MSQNTWTVELEKDPKTGELLLSIPSEILSQLGWSEGTDIWWEFEDNKIVLKEITNETSKPK
jgi:hypothetical protein